MSIIAVMKIMYAFSTAVVRPKEYPRDMGMKMVNLIVKKVPNPKTFWDNKLH